MLQALKRQAQKAYNILAGKKELEKNEVTMSGAAKAPMFLATLRIVHKDIPKPIVHRNKIQAISISQVLKNMKLTPKQNCDIRNKGKTSWVDTNGAAHELQIEKMEVS